MLILYGDKTEVDRNFQFLNLSHLFDNDVYCIYTNDLVNIKNIDNILKNAIKVFICREETSVNVLKNNLLSNGCFKDKICVLNEQKIRLAFIMRDLDYRTTNHNILGSLLCDFTNLMKVYANYLLNDYNQTLCKADVAFDFLMPNDHTRIIDLAISMQKEYKTVSFFLENINTNIKNSICLKAKDTIHGMTQMTGINNYKVLVTSNAQSHQSAITVNILHNIVKKPLTRYSQFKANTFSDYNLIPTDDMFEKTKSILVEYQYLLDKEICLVPFGSSKLDKITNDIKEYKKNNRTKRKAICYAPASLIHNNKLTTFLSLSNGESIVNILLENFKNYDIIFRPHPNTKNTQNGKEYINNIVNRYSQNKQFIYDDNIDYISTFAQTELLVSDFSSIGLTFTFATLKPLLSLSKEGFNEHYRKVFNKDDIRKDYGLVLNNIDELSQKIQYMIDNKKEFKSKIKKYRKEQVFNYGKSVDYFVNNFDYIRDKKKHPDWFYINNKSTIDT